MKYIRLVHINNDFPLAIMLAFIGGIAASSIFEGLPKTPLILMSITIFIFLATFYFLRIHNIFKYVIIAAVFVTGAAYLNSYMSIEVNPNHISSYATKKGYQTVEGVVTEREKENEKGEGSFVLDVKKILVNGDEKVITGKILVKVKDVTYKIENGDLVRVIGRITSRNSYKNPGAFNYVRFLRGKGIDAACNIYKDKNISVIKNGYNKGIIEQLLSVREKANDFIYSNGISENKYIVSALLFGNSKQIEQHDRKLFVNTGTSHILAISGLHMAVVSVFFYSILIFFFKRSERFTLEHNIIKLAYLITLILLIFYSFLIGMRPSAVRAVIMIGVYILSLLIGRGHNTLRTMVVAAFLILLIYPASLYDLSFLLSFSSIFAILYFCKPISLELNNYFNKYYVSNGKYFKKEKGVIPIIKNSILVFIYSFIVTLTILPIILYNFNYVSLSSPLINAIAVPIYSIIIIPINFVIFILSLIFQPAASLVLHINEYIIHLSIVLLRFLDRYVNYSVYAATPKPIEIIAYYGLLFSLFKIKERKAKNAAVICASLLVLSGFYYKFKPLTSNALTVNFLDVSQGESILVQFPNGENMLVDGGGFGYKRDSSNFDIGRDVIAKFLWKMKISKVDYIVSTHPHPDHISGLFFIAENFNPDKIFVGKHKYNEKLYKEFSNKFNDNIQYVSYNNKMLEIGGTTVEFYNYDYDGTLDNNTGVNRSSLAIMLKYKDKKIFLTSDIDNSIEDYMINKGVNLKSNVLKIAHHGSKDSTSQRFLEAVSPEYAVISVGYNNSQHLPAVSTINRLTDDNVKLFRTDTDGMITVQLDDKITLTKFVK